MKNKTELETHQRILDEAIQEYLKDKDTFWLVHMKEAISSVLYLNKTANNH